MPDTVTLEKMSIKSEHNSKEFVAFVNPATINYRVNIRYNMPERAGANTQPVQFNFTEPERISFALDIDGTGVIGNTKIDVDVEINKFKEVTLDYDGEIHEPPEVTVSWGSLILKSKLESLDVNYSLFSPNGRPLRAKLNISFVGSMDEKEASKRRSNSSPDLSHVRIVQAGDTLPLMCYKIYGDSAMYLEVARMNNLVDFRHLKPGTEILFPPIKK